MNIDNTTAQELAPTDDIVTIGDQVWPILQ